MKMKKVISVLIVILLLSIMPIFAVNTYLNGVLTIDSQWDTTSSKGLGDEITRLISPVSSVTSLTISAGEITDEDITWIRKNLSGLVTLTVDNNATFTTESIGGQDVMLLPVRAFSAVSGRNADENGVLNSLRTIVIDIDDAAIIHLAEENFAFLDSLESIRIDEVRDFVGKSCFWQSSSMTSVTMDNLTNMTYTTSNIGAFEDCNALTTISFPSLTHVGKGAFNGCNLINIDLPAVTTVGDYVFTSNTNLISVTLPEVLTFGTDAFFSCSKLETVNFPKVTSMGTEAFESCRKLKNVSLPSLTTLGERAFKYCTDLESVVLPELITSGVGLFNECTSLTSLETTKLVNLGDLSFHNASAFTWKVGNTPFDVSGFNNTPKFAIYYEIANAKIAVADTTAYLSFDDGNTGDNLWYGWTVISSVNHAPTVANPIADIASVTENTGITVDLTNVFADVDAGDSITITTDKGSIDGMNLTYTPINGDIVATTITITVTATDTSAASVDDVFVLSSITPDPTQINLTEVQTSTDYGKINFESRTDTAGTLYVLAVLTSDTTTVDTDYVIANGSLHGRTANEFRTGIVREEGGTYDVYFLMKDNEDKKSDLIKVENVVVPVRVTITHVQNNITIHGSNNGSVHLTANGHGTYEYKIDNVWQNSPVFNSLSAGSYSAYAREKSNTANISLRLSITLTEPGAPDQGTDNTQVSTPRDTSNSTPITVPKKTPLEKEIEKELKKKNEGKTVFNVKLSTDESGDAAVAIPKGFAGEKIDLKIETDDVNVIIKGDMFKGDEKDVKLLIKPKKKEDLGLSKEDRALIGNLPVFDISISIDNKHVDWSSDENIKINFPLKTEGKKAHQFVAVYINDQGKVEILRKSVFKGNSIEFNTKHLSYYSIMYIDKTFEDTKSHWAKEAIEALASRGITSGTSESTFSPDKTITRAEFVTLVVQYFGLESQETMSYNDVESKTYYANAVATAKTLGLLPAIYKDEFKPDMAITREDVMTILYNALVVTKNDTLEDKELSIQVFTDKIDLVYYAVKGADYFVSRDIVHGYDNQLKPKDMTTRAEVAQLLYSILKSTTE
jgi:hypothetical protein